MKKFLLLTAMFGLLLSSCGGNGGNETPSNPEDNTPYAEGTDEYVYSMNRLKNANYDFALDFKEEDIQSTRRSNKNVHTKSVTDTNGYDISNMEGYHYNLFAQTESMLKMTSDSAKMFVQQYTEQVKVLNKAIEIVPEEHPGEGEVIVVPPEEHFENELLPRLDIQKNMAMVSYDEETDEVYLVVHDKYGGITSVRLSTDARGVETVEYFTCSIRREITYQVYTPNYLCRYTFMHPMQSGIGEGPIGYGIDEVFFQAYPGAIGNWFGYSYNGFLTLEALEKDELELSDMLSGDIEYFYTSSSHFEVGVSHRLFQYGEGDDIPEDKTVGDYHFDMRRTQSSFASYTYKDLNFWYRISEFNGFETVYTKMRDFYPHNINTVEGRFDNEFYTVNLMEDDYIAMSNGKNMYPEMLRINDDGTAIYPFVWDGQPSTDYDLGLGFGFDLVKGNVEGNYYEDFTVLNNIYGTIYTYSDKTYQNINNVINLFKYYGITIKDDYFSANAFDYFMKIVKDPSQIINSAKYYSDGATPEGYRKLVNSSEKQVFALMDDVLHFFDNKEVVLSTELKDIPNVQLANLTGSPVLTISEDTLSLGNISFNVNRNRLFNDGNEYTVVLVMNNKMLDAGVFNKVTYNGQAMSFTSNSGSSYPLPALEGQYSFSLVLVKVVEGGYVPVSNYLSVNINDIVSFQKDTEDENIKLQYEVIDDKLIITQIDLSPEEEE